MLLHKYLETDVIHWSWWICSFSEIIQIFYVLLELLFPIIQKLNVPPGIETGSLGLIPGLSFWKLRSYAWVTFKKSERIRKVIQTQKIAFSAWFLKIQPTFFWLAIWALQKSIQKRLYLQKSRLEISQFIQYVGTTKYQLLPYALRTGVNTLWQGCAIRTSQSWPRAKIS